MILHLLLGLALGAGSSVLPGPCNLAVMTAAWRHGRRRAVATALGAALGDALYATLGILGVGRVLARHPTVPPVLQLISGVALIGYGLVQLVRMARPPAPGPAATGRGRGTRAGVGVGLVVLLANPAALLTWVVIVGAALGTASPVEQVSVAIGVGLGSFAWFGGVAYLSCRGPAAPGGGLRRLTRAVCTLLVGYGVVSLVRGLSG